MQKRQITMQDGRYLIFYTFEEHAESPVSEPKHDHGAQNQPAAKPEAEEERSV